MPLLYSSGTRCRVLMILNCSCEVGDFPKVRCGDGKWTKRTLLGHGREQVMFRTWSRNERADLWYLWLFMPTWVLSAYDILGSARVVIGLTGAGNRPPQGPDNSR